MWRSALVLGVAAGLALANGAAGGEGSGEARRQAAVAYAEQVAARIAGFEDAAVAADLLARLGRRTCRYDKDAGAAILRTAFRFVSDGGDAGAAGSRARPARSLKAAGRECDPALAAEIETLSGQAGEGFLERAGRLTWEDPEKAAAVLSRGAGDFLALGPGEQGGFLLSLLQIRRRAPEAADAAFGEVLRAVGAAPEVTVSALSMLAAYAFADPARRTKLALPADVVEGERLYRFGRPGPDTLSAGAYLDTALALIGTDRVRGSPAARRIFLERLSPIVEKLAPADVPALRERIAALRLPPSLAPRAPAGNPADGLRLMQFATAWQAGRWERAREAAGEISDEDLRDELEGIIDYGRARERLETGDVETAVGLAAKLRPGVLRALLYLGAGACGPKERRRGYLLAALDDARKASAPLPRLFFRLVAEQLAGTDPELAFTVLEEMLAASQEEAAEAQDEDAPYELTGRRGRIYLALGTGGFGRAIDVTPPCVEAPGLPDLLVKLAEHNEDRADVLASRIPGERERGSALVKLAVRRLRNAFERRGTADARGPGESKSRVP